MLRKLPDDMGKVSGADPLVKRMRSHTAHGNRHAFTARGLDERLFFLLILVYHIAITFQGIDLLDEGFHAVFYQRIFSDPSSVQYSFFYWFSGIVGGAMLNIAPELGLWGLRLAGALVSVATILIAYRLLRNYIPSAILQSAIAILALYINTEPKDIHYNTISALLFFAAAALMFFGLTKERKFLLFLSGGLLALNVFTRLPNILGAGMGIAILYSGYVLDRKRKDIMVGMGYFISGFLISIGLVLLVMKMIGHLEIYIDSIKFLYSLTTTTGEQDGLSGSYGISRLFYVLVKQHSMSILLVLLIGTVTVLYKFISDTTIKIGERHFDASMVLPFILTITLLWLMVSGRINLQYLTYLFTGISVITSAIYLWGNYSHGEKLLSLLGLFIMAVHPFGSAPGIMTVMIYSLWINFPMAVAMLCRLAGKDCEFSVRIGRDSWNLFINRNAYLKKTLQWSAAMILALCLHHIFVFPYFYDKHFRTEMTHAINSPATKYIYTSRGRATAINEMLAASNKFIAKGSSVLAYDAIPMFHFMTGTRPFLPNSTPMFYTNQQFANELNRAVGNQGLPVIVQQKIYTIHEGSGWPEDVVENSNLQGAVNDKRNLIFNNFLASNNYREAWSNNVFRILVPPGKNDGR